MCQGIKGAPPHLIRRLYICTAIPSFLYAVDIFLPDCSVRRTKTGEPQYLRRGPLAKLAATQRQAVLATTGAMRTMATDAAEVHANLLPFNLLISKLCLQAVLRYATLPSSHPLAKIAKQASALPVKRHRSKLHAILAMHQIQPANMEKRLTASSNLAPTPTFTTSILERMLAKNIRAPRLHEMHVYTDGSGIEGKVGAAAATRDRSGRWKTIKYELGTLEQHTVYEAKLIGMLLAIHMANSVKNLRKLTIYTDNQAAIKVLEDSAHGTQSYLTDHLNKSCEQLKKRRKGATVDIRWVPGHEGMIGNEKVDVEAKEAALQGSSPAKSLPVFLR